MVKCDSKDYTPKKDHMKKAMLFCALLIGFGVHAQHHAREHTQRTDAQKQLAPEERATIQSKRMTLALGLDETQQDQVAALLKKHLDARIALRSKRESEGNTEQMKDPEKRYARMNAHLDREIAFQKELRSILSESQFDKWQVQRERTMAKHQRHKRQREMPKHTRRRG
jgi:hypothetical protein